MSEKLDKIFKDTHEYLTKDSPTYSKLENLEGDLDIINKYMPDCSNIINKIRNAVEGIGTYTFEGGNDNEIYEENMRKLLNKYTGIDKDCIIFNWTEDNSKCSISIVGQNNIDAMKLCLLPMYINDEHIGNYVCDIQSITHPIKTEQFDILPIPDAVISMESTIKRLQYMVTEVTGVPEKYWNLSEPDYCNMIKMRNDRLIKHIKSKYNLE